jgi:hypothetical protein
MSLAIKIEGASMTVCAHTVNSLNILSNNNRKEGASMVIKGSNMEVLSVNSSNSIIDSSSNVNNSNTRSIKITIMKNHLREKKGVGTLTIAHKMVESSIHLEERIKISSTNSTRSSKKKFEDK